MEASRFFFFASRRAGFFAVHWRCVVPFYSVVGERCSNYLSRSPEAVHLCRTRGKYPYTLPPPYSSCRISYRGLFSACKITATAQNNVIRLLCRVRRAKRVEFFIRRGVYFVLVHVSHLVGSTACGSTGNGLRDAETVLIFYPTYERCVFRMVSSSCSLFSPFSSI